MTLTCVSGYWKIKNKHDKDGEKFRNWFNNTLKINCSYVFFSDKETRELIKKYRGDLPTHYVDCSIDQFYTYQYRNKMVTHTKHCPSIELNLIWNEKIFLLQKASKINPFNSSYFMWVDAGLSCYRRQPPPTTPFPNVNKLINLPKKFIYSASSTYIPNKVTRKTYYHHISGTYILHNSIVDKFVNIYKKYLDKLVDKNNIWTDQVILTHIYKNHKHLFHKLCSGYGKILAELY